MKSHAYTVTDAEAAVAPRVGAWIEMTRLKPATPTATGSLPVWERGLKLKYLSTVSENFTVAPRVGAWIEIVIAPEQLRVTLVAPCVGAWIEIQCLIRSQFPRAVAPRVGAWIEIPYSRIKSSTVAPVAPRVGAWIEIPSRLRLSSQPASLPVWERGLK